MAGAIEGVMQSLQVQLALQATGTVKVVADLQKVGSQVDRITKQVEKSTQAAEKNADTWSKVSYQTDKTGKIVGASVTAYRKQGDAVSSATAKLEDHGKGLKQVSAVNEGLGKSLSNLLSVFTKFRWLLVNFAMVIGLFVGLKKIVDWADNVEDSMNKVSAVTGKTTDSVLTNVEKMRRGTIFSMKEVGDSLFEVSKKGYDLEDSMLIVDASMTLAVGGFTDLATATDVVTNVLKTFNLSAEDSVDVINALTYVALNTSATIEGLAQALGTVGPVAQVAGISHNELIAALGLLNNKIPNVSKAATALRSSIAKIIDPTEEVKDSMYEAGLSFYDTEGNLLNLSRAFRSLGSALSDMETQQEKLQFIMEMFGIRASTGAAALIDLMENHTFAMDEMTAATIIWDAAEEAASKRMEARKNKNKAANEELKSIGIDTSSGLAKAWSAMATSFSESFTQEDRMIRVQRNLALMADEGKTTYAELAKLAGLEILGPKMDTGTGKLTSELKESTIERLFKGKMATPMPFGEVIKNTKSVEEQLISLEEEYDRLITKFTTEQKEAGLPLEQYMDGILELMRVQELYQNVENNTIDTQEGAQVALGGVVYAQLQYKHMIIDTNRVKQLAIDIDNGNIESTKEYVTEIRNAVDAFEDFKQSYNKLTTTTYADQLANEASEVDKLKQAQKELKEELIEGLQKKGATYDMLVEIRDNYYSEYDALSKLISLAEQDIIAKERETRITNELAKASFMYQKILSKLKDELSDIQDTYNSYAKARFAGETASLQHLHEMELAIKKEELAQLELGDTVENTSDTLNREANEYKAWVDTIHEVIRALIKEGNANASNVSKVVRNQQTLLLQSSKFQIEKDKEKTKLEEMQDALDIEQLKHEINYDEKHYAVQEYIDALDKEREQNWNTSEEAISAIQGVITKLEEKQNAIDDVTKDYEKMTEAVSFMKAGLENYTEVMSQSVETWISALDDYILKVNQAINANANLGGGGGSGPGFNDNGDAITTTSPWNAWVTPSGNSYDPYHRNFNDFVMRPGEGPVAFSPQDTIVGFKGDSPMGGSVTIENINVSGVSGDPSEIAYELAREIRRELNALG